MKKIEEKYKKLTDIEHVLLRPSMYIGSIKPTKTYKYVLENNVFVYNEVSYVPGFVKLFDEIIMNSIDESRRAGSKLNIIKVSIEKNKIAIYDNGGIDVFKNKEKEWIPEMVFSNLRAGSNFSDSDERTWAGTNGVGSSCVNIFSKQFNVSTCDGKKSFYQEYYSNMRNRTDPIIKKNKDNHTEITFFPDFEKFNMENIDNDHFRLMEKKVYDLAACNTHVKFYFNDNLIDFNSFEDYIKMYKSELFYEENKDKTWSIGISYSDNGFKQISFANSTETPDGGTHIEYIIGQIIVHLKEYFIKKHKVDIKPNDIRNHIFLFLNSTVINPSFSSQTKEKLITEVKNYGYSYEISKKMIQSILKSEIVDRILDWIEQKKKADESKIERELNRKIVKTKVDKLIDAKSKERWKCSLAVFEGDSAAASFRKYRNPNLMGAFSLRGKFINVSEITNQKLMQNNEALNLMASIGLKIGKSVNIKDLRYGRILLYVDADCLEENTIILTKNGNKKISDINYNDEVLTHTGEYKKVKNIISKDISKYIKVIVNGNTFLCSEEHKLIVFREGEVVEIKAKDLKYSDCLLLKDEN